MWKITLRNFKEKHLRFVCHFVRPFFEHGWPPKQRFKFPYNVKHCTSLAIEHALKCIFLQHFGIVLESNCDLRVKEWSRAIDVATLALKPLISFTKMECIAKWAISFIMRFIRIVVIRLEVSNELQWIINYKWVSYRCTCTVHRRIIQYRNHSAIARCPFLTEMKWM